MEPEDPMTISCGDVTNYFVYTFIYLGSLSMNCKHKSSTFQLGTPQWFSSDDTKYSIKGHPDSILN